MADASRGLTYHHLVNVAQWHINDDNYVAARAAIINAHHKHPLAALWDDGTTSSSDGQYFRAGGRASGGRDVNAKYGIDPGAVFYTHDSGRVRPVRHQGHHRHAERGTLRPGRPAPSRPPDRPQDRGALHRHRRRDRPRVRPVPPARIRVRAADQGPQGPQALHDREARDVSAAGTADRRRGRRRRDRRAMARTDAPQTVDRGGRDHPVRDPAQAVARPARATRCRARCAPSAGSSGRCSRCNGYPTPPCANAATRGSTRARPATALRRAIFFHRQGEIRDRTFENQSFGRRA